LSPSIGTRQAALAVFAATGMFVHPLGGEGGDWTTGRWIYEQLYRFAVQLPGGEAEDTGTADTEGRDG
jgi:hypothetical protein